MKSLSIAKKMSIFALVVFLSLVFAVVGKIKSSNEVSNEFMMYSQKATKGKIAVTQIQADMNYISRCTRDIMLNNEYDKNVDKIKKRIESIDKSFKILKDSVKGALKEGKKQEIVDNAYRSTMEFVNDGYNKMVSLGSTKLTPETLANMYQQYKKDATPLAIKSRKYFKEIKEIKDNSFKKRMESMENKITQLQQGIIIESIVLLIIIMGYTLYITKDLLNSINKLHFGVKSLLINKNTSSRVNVNSTDEIGLIATDFNIYLQSIEDGINEDKRFLEDADVVLNRLSHGWLSQRIEANTSNPSLNKLKVTINDALNNLKSQFVNINIILEEYVHNDYRKELELNSIEKGGVFDLLLIDINKLKNSITKILIENKSNGITLQNSSTTLLDNVSALSSAANQAAASLEETASAIEEITSNIKNNTNNVIEMANYGNEVKNSVENGQNLANQTTTAMDEINVEVTAINDAISVIDQIAFQTNILSLNAAVEAATAGEAGKGFAVVAQEVRNLASRSADAANEIKALVHNATDKANNGKSIADEMIEGYSHLNKSISTTLSLISDVEIASKKQQNGMEQINNAITELDQQTQQNANVANSTKDIAVQTQEISYDIVDNVNKKEFIGKDSIS